MKISEKQLRQIVSTIANEYRPLRILLFGSYRKGTPRDSSDVDLLIIKDTEVVASRRAAEVHRIFNPYLYDLDIIVMTPDEFDTQKNEINTLAYFVNNEGKLVYERSLQGMVQEGR